jgi:hypothetical protein
MRLHRPLSVLGALIVAAALCEQTNVPRLPQGNNTSAVDSFSGQPNGNAPAGNVSKLPIRSRLYQGATTKIFVRWMPWFGQSKHIDIGYSSDSEQEIRHQVDDMMSRGVDAAIVDYYGPQDDFKERATERLFREAERRGGQFLVALSIDKGSVKGCPGDCTGDLLGVMNYAARKYESSPAYLRAQGRPAVFFFGLEQANVDWQRVHSGAQGNPLLFFRNSGAFRRPEADGAYSWMAPESVKPGDPLGLEYLERFNRAAQTSDKLVVASAYKGFDDSIAGWSKHRRIPQNCGETWLQTFAVANQFFSASHPLWALLIPTWNDYEEGTEIETGIENCAQLSATLEGNTVRWNVSGAGNDTMDHFEILAASGSDVINAAPAPRSAHSFDLGRLQLPPGRYAIFVAAVGRPSIRNHLAAAGQYAAGAP